MATLPTKQQDLLEFAAQHADLWDGSPTSVGLSAATVTLIKNANELATMNYNDAQAARAGSKAATFTSDLSMDALRAVLGDAIKTIRAFAESTNNPLVYSAAQIPPPAPPTPALPPTQATNLGAAIETTGALTISWKPAASSTGYNSSTKNVVYTVKRRFTTDGAFTTIGVLPAVRAGTRGVTTFTDDTLPRSAASGTIQYVISAVRALTDATLVGPDSVVFNVMLGVGSGGGGFSIVSQGEDTSGQMKMAA